MTPSQQQAAIHGWKESPASDMIRAVVITTRDRCYVPSWAHYLTAEGDASELTIYFSMYAVRIKGYGLDRLLRLLTTQRVSELSIPKRADRFSRPVDTPGITEITVEATKSK
jgi:hypothetical protein